MMHERCRTHFNVALRRCSHCGMFWCPRCRMWFASSATPASSSPPSPARATARSYESWRNCCERRPHHAICPVSDTARQPVPASTAALMPRGIL